MPAITQRRCAAVRHTGSCCAPNWGTIPRQSYPGGTPTTRNGEWGTWKRSTWKRSQAIASAGADHPASVDQLAPAEGLADNLSVAPEIAPARRASTNVRRWGAVIGVAAVIAAGVLCRVIEGICPPILTFWRSLRSTCSIRRFRSGTRGWWTCSPGTSTVPDRSHSPADNQPEALEGRADRVSAEHFGRRTGSGLVVWEHQQSEGHCQSESHGEGLSRSGAETDLEVKGEISSTGGLADSLGVRILQVLGQNRPIGAVRRVSIGSRSLPALKAFLYGEQFYRRGLWDSALVHYDQAIAQDSTFALAFRRMNLVLSWFPASSNADQPMEEYLRKSIRLNHGVSPKDSLLIAVDSFSSRLTTQPTPPS